MRIASSHFRMRWLVDPAWHVISGVSLPRHVQRQSRDQNFISYLMISTPQTGDRSGILECQNLK